MKKKIFFSVCFLLAHLSVNAVSHATSGEYIFYRDNSFKDESFVGFLYFDEFTYAARYFSGTTDITLYLALREDKNEIKGEKIVGDVKAGDEQIVNYLRELFWEMLQAKKGAPAKIDMKAAKKKRLIDGEEKKTAKNVAIFGGDIYVCYDLLCPLFYVKSLKNLSGKTLLEVVTAGKIWNDKDNSFLSFKGFSKKEVKKMPSLKIKSEGEKEYTLSGGQSIKISESWERKAENQWMLKNSAMILMVKSDVKVKNKKAELFSLLSRFIMSADGTYVDWSQSEIEKKANGFYADLRVESDGQSMRIFKRADLVKGHFYLFILSAYEEAFMENKSYFSQIINTYKIK